MIRNMLGFAVTRAKTFYSPLSYADTGSFLAEAEYADPYTMSRESDASLTYVNRLTFDPGRVVPVGNANKPRAWGALPCVYLGAPR